MSGRRVVVLDHTAERGGAEIALQRLLGALDASWHVTVLLFAEGAFRDSLQADGFDVEVLALPERTAGRGRHSLTSPGALVRSGVDTLRFSRRLARRLRELAPDLVVANSLKSAVLAETSRWQTELPWVWHLHDRLASDYLPAPVTRAMRLLATRAAHVVANSHAVADLTGLRPGRVSVAYPGLPDDAFAARGSEPAPPVVGLLGRISPTKGQREFIEAAARVHKSSPDVRFRIVGEALFSDQPYAEEIRRLPEALGIAGSVEFPGWASDPRVALDGFSLLVHASPVPEPFGQVIVEAMARGVPVVATLGGGVGEIFGVSAAPAAGEGIVQTPYGRLVRSHDVAGLAEAISLALSDPDQAAALATAAQARTLDAFALRRSGLVVDESWSAALDSLARKNRTSH